MIYKQIEFCSDGQKRKLLQQLQSYTLFICFSGDDMFDYFCNHGSMVANVVRET